MKKLYKHKKDGKHLYFSLLSHLEYSSNESSYAGLTLQLDYSLNVIKGKRVSKQKYAVIFPFILHNYPKSEIN